VSAALDSRQSKQLIEAFYLWTVEGVRDGIVGKVNRGNQERNIVSK